jgi:hypothetical protein
VLAENFTLQQQSLQSRQALQHVQHQHQHHHPTMIRRWNACRYNWNSKSNDRLEPKIHWKRSKRSCTHLKPSRREYSHAAIARHGNGTRTRSKKVGIEMEKNVQDDCQSQLETASSPVLAGDQNNDDDEPNKS